MHPSIERLRKLRSEQAITLNEIGVALGCPEKTVWRWLTNGDHPRPQYITKINAYVERANVLLAKDEKQKIELYEGIVLDIIYSREAEAFWAAPKPGERYSEASYPVGVVRVDRWYETFRQRCEIYGNDRLLLTAFNNLAQRGSIKILNIWIPTSRPLKASEGFAFKFEVGEARRKIPGQDLNFEMVRVYKDEPLDEAEMIPSAIRNPKEVVEKIRKSRAEGARARYGHYDLSKESELRREELEDESAQRMSNKDLFEILRAGGKTMAEGDFAPSEFDSLPDEKVKTREIYEVKIENKTRAPMIVYNHDGSKVEIQPGESAIQTKMRFIKKIPVVDKEREKE